MHATTNINYNQFNRFETSSDYIAAGQWKVGPHDIVLHANDIVHDVIPNVHDVIP